MAALLGIMTGVPSSVRAACGDYAISGKAAPHAQPSSPPAADQKTPSHRKESPAAPRCHGLTCTPGDVPPPVPPPFPTSAGGERWGCLCGTCVPEEFSSGSCTPSAFCPLACERADDIFHPPRSRRNLTP